MVRTSSVVYRNGCKGASLNDVTSCEAGPLASYCPRQHTHVSKQACMQGATTQLGVRSPKFPTPHACSNTHRWVYMHASTEQDPRSVPDCQGCTSIWPLPAGTCGLSIYMHPRTPHQHTTRPPATSLCRNQPSPFPSLPSQPTCPHQRQRWGPRRLGSDMSHTAPSRSTQQTSAETWGSASAGLCGWRASPSGLCEPSPGSDLALSAALEQDHLLHSTAQHSTQQRVCMRYTFQLDFENRSGLYAPSPASDPGPSAATEQDHLWHNTAQHSTGQYTADHAHKIHIARKTKPSALCKPSPGSRPTPSAAQEQDHLLHSTAHSRQRA